MFKKLLKRFCIDNESLEDTLKQYESDLSLEDINFIGNSFHLGGKDKEYLNKLKLIVFLKENN